MVKPIHPPGVVENLVLAATQVPGSTRSLLRWCAHEPGQGFPALLAPQHGDHLGERQIAAVLNSERSGNVMRSDGSIGNVNDSLSLRQYDLLHLSSRHDFGSELRLMPDPQAGAYSSLALSTTITKSVKKAIADNVAGLFNDRSRGEKPVVIRQTDGLFGPDAVARRVHGDVTSMMVGGIAGLLLQMLHPAVLAGVWDHSNFRSDMQGRLRRTARFIALTTYGEQSEAEATIARVRGIHARVTGNLPNGSAYSANDPALLAWVHVTETTSFLAAWIRYAEPNLSPADQDRYFVEMARIASALGALPIPLSRSEAGTQIQVMRPYLRYDARTREVARLVLRGRAPNIMAEPVQALTMQAAVDLLPAWARRMHGLSASTFSRPLVRAGMLGIAQTLRWAFE